MDELTRAASDPNNASNVGVEQGDGGGGGVQANSSVRGLALLAALSTLRSRCGRRSV